MAKMQHGLGRGLGALLGDTSDIRDLRKPVGYINKEIVNDAVRQDTSDILRVPVERIEPNPFQPRMSFDPDALAELADSIRSFGLVQPITVRRKADGKYQIISGERRYRAARMAGMDMIPAYIRDANDQGMLEMAIVENIQRENLDPIEVAMSYRRLLRLPAKVQHDLKVGLVSVGHAKVLLGIEDPAVQEALCDAIVKHGLSVRQLEDRVRKLSETPHHTEEQELPEVYYRVLEHIGRYFGDNISLRRSKNGKGTITIHFNSDGEMAGFLQALDEKGR